MKDNTNLKIIAHIKTDFPTKFGIPRQSGLVKTAKGIIVFTEDYRSPEALRGIDDYSHLWLLWKFSENAQSGWSPTVRPPRLGGNKRVGVFATRSPFRPNPIGLSCVKLERVIYDTPLGAVLEVSGVDLLDSTPIYDIKPYIPYTDSHPEANGGFSEKVFGHRLNVTFADGESEKLSNEKLLSLTEILAEDPRPAYQQDNERIYSFEFSDFNIKFSVSEQNLFVREIKPLK